MAEATLTIERLHCRLFLPEGSDRPAARDRLERIARRDVSAACAAVLSSLPGDGDAVYRIRRLHLNLHVDLQGMGEDEIARRWGRLLAAAVTKALLRGDSREVVRFDSPRDFVTAFLRDLLDGRAWSRWVWAELRPLERLPVPRLAAELLAPRPEWIAPVFAALAGSGHAERLFALLDAPEAERLAEALGVPATPGPELAAPPAGLASLASAWREVPEAGDASPAGRARAALRLALALVQAQGDRPLAVPAGACVRALVEIAALVRREPDLAPLLEMRSGLHPEVERRIAAGPLADAARWLAPLAARKESSEPLARLAAIAAPGAVRPELDDPLARLAATPSRPRPAALTSPVGSVALLLPAVAELGLWEMWSAESGEEAARRYLYVLWLKALGRERAVFLLGDPVLTRLAGLAEPPVADARLPREPGGAAPAWMDRLPDRAALWYPAHEHDLVAGVARGLEILRDARAACWLAARPESEGRGNSQERETGARQPTPEEAAALDSEAAHLQLGPRLGYAWLTPELDAALSVAASLALRRTAARLPGFAQAGPAWLARQFLAQPARLREGKDGFTVELSGGPLMVVLRLAALPEELRVPWLPEPVRLRLGGAGGV